MRFLNTEITNRSPLTGHEVKPDDLQACHCLMEKDTYYGTYYDKYFERNWN